MKNYSWLLKYAGWPWSPLRFAIDGMLHGIGVFFVHLFGVVTTLFAPLILGVILLFSREARDYVTQIRVMAEIQELEEEVESEGEDMESPDILSPPAPVAADPKKDESGG